MSITITQSQKEAQQGCKALVDKGMKQSYLSRILDVSEGTVSDLIRGKKEFSEGLISKVSDKLKKYHNTDKNEMIKDVSQYKVIYNTANYCLSDKKSRFNLIIGGSGLGKSEVLKEFARQNVNRVYMIRIEKGVSWRQLLEAIAIEFGELEAQGRGSKRTYKRIHSSKLLLLIKRFVENSMERPLLIIDEAEEIPNGTLRNLKNLYTATEGLLSILICGINKVRDNLYKLAGMKPDGSLKDDNIQNKYTTFVRRLTFIKVPQIGIDDLKIYCNQKGVTDKKTIDMIHSTGLWWNYQSANDMIDNAGADNLNGVNEKDFRSLYYQYN